MRIVAEIPYAQFKITIFHWNNRYLVKLESGSLEQTFKISEFDVTSEEEVRNLLDEGFLREAIARFEEMAKSLSNAWNRQW